MKRMIWLAVGIVVCLVVGIESWAAHDWLITVAAAMVLGVHVTRYVVKC